MHDTNRLGIVVPYRNEPLLLNIFVPTLSRYLATRGVIFNIYIIEQTGDKPFNRGKCINIGYKKFNNFFNYFVTHDIDLLPINPTYGLRGEIIVLSHIRNDAIYPNTYLGGVVSFPKDKFELVNGFSNNYWGWGEEDNDMRVRIMKKGINYAVLNEGRYYHFDHDARDISNIGNNNQLFRDMEGGKIDSDKEGLNSLDLDIDSLEVFRGVSPHKGVEWPYFLLRWE